MQTSPSDFSQDASAPSLSLTASTAKTPHLRIAHVLFMDIIGYSKLPMHFQAEVQSELQHLVEETPDVIAARRAPGTLICRPTGDGMALLFFQDMLAPVRCALTVQQALHTRSAQHEKRWGKPFALRMGIHSGPVLCTEDINAQEDVAGEGIVLAQRIMDAGDADHILLSQAVAEAIGKISPWHKYLHDLGLYHAKHGQEIHLFNLYGKTAEGTGFGSSKLPHKIGAEAAQRVEMARNNHAAREKRDAVIVEETQRGNFNALVLSLLALLIVGGGAGALFLISPAFREFTKSAVQNATRKAPEAVTPATSGKEPAAVTPEMASEMTAQPVAKDSRAAPVALQHSNGPPASRTTEKMPLFIGKTFAEAQFLAESQGFHLVESQYSSSESGSSEGIITRQDRRAGKYYRAGTTVHVRLSYVSEEPATSAETSSATHGIVASKPFTGLLIDTRHLGVVQTDQNATICGPGDEPLYPSPDNQPSAGDTQDIIVGYYQDEAGARSRCGNNPLVIKATAIVNGCNVRIGAEDASRLQELDSLLHFTQDWKRVGFLKR